MSQNPFAKSSAHAAPSRRAESRRDAGLASLFGAFFPIVVDSGDPQHRLESFYQRF